MDQIITFDKSLQTRLSEYEEVFSGLEALPYYKIQREWTYYLELTLDPNGWQAIWKIPRLKCEEFKIPFPTVVLVFVVNVNFCEHMSLVRVLAVQDEIHLPEKHYVPLIQLWPTKDQDKSIALNLNSTANVLDMLRFFYIHLLMPWDEDEDSNDWKTLHLVSRLRLFYDLKNGKIPKATAEHIHALLNEARRLNGKRKLLISTCDEIDSDIETENGCVNTNTAALIEINVRLIEIQQEMFLLENEIFRSVLVKRQESSLTTDKNEKQVSQLWLIFSNGKASDYLRFLQLIEDLYPNETLKFEASLMAKLQSALPFDTILLGPIEHQINSEGALIENFTIKGIGDKQNIKVLSQAEDVMFDCIGDTAIFENITFYCKDTQCAILIRKGHVILKDCQLIGSQTSTTHQGILVLKGAKLTVTNCNVTGFSMAIIGNSGSEIDVRDSVLHGAAVGIKVYDNSKLGLRKTTIKNCKEYGVVVETDQDYADNKIVGDLEKLSLVSNFEIESSQSSNNKKGDVIIKKTKIHAIENLFADPDLDPTILESSDEEMETSFNTTVLEVEATSKQNE